MFYLEVGLPAFEVIAYLILKVINLMMLIFIYFLNAAKLKI